MAAMAVTLMEWRALNKNSLRGFAKVRLGKALILKDVAVHYSNGKTWAMAPAKPIINPDGVAKKDDRGKIQYVPIIEWFDRDMAQSFSDGVVAAVLAEYPSALQA
jgi:hypothetical protein